MNVKGLITHGMLVSVHAGTHLPLAQCGNCTMDFLIHQSPTSESENAPQNVSFVEIEQDIVALELSFTGTENTLVPQVLVHLLQTL